MLTKATILDTTHFLQIDQEILEFINANPLLITNMKVEDLATSLYTSNATIIRFCKKLGYSGFNELKYYIKEKLSTTTIKTTNHRNYIEHDLMKYQDFITTIDTANINQMIAIICSDCQLYIHGRSVSAIPAKYLYTVLNSIDRRCIFINDLHLLRSLSKNLDDSSAVIIVSAGANKDTYGQIMEDIKLQHSKVILLSSNSDSELHDIATISIATSDCPTTYHDTDVNTRIELITVIQLLIELSCQKLMEK